MVSLVRPDLVLPKAILTGTVDVTSAQAQRGGQDEQHMLDIHRASEQYGNEVSRPIPNLCVHANFNMTDGAPLLLPPSLDRLHQFVCSRIQRHCQRDRALCCHLPRVEDRYAHHQEHRDPDLDVGCGWYHDRYRCCNLWIRACLLVCS